MLHRRRQPNSQHRLTHAKVPKNIPQAQNYHQATLILARQPLRCSNNNNTVSPKIQRFMACFIATFHKVAETCLTNTDNWLKQRVRETWTLPPIVTLSGLPLVPASNHLSHSTSGLLGCPVNSEAGGAAKGRDHCLV
ncbi:hypothetical protein FVEG_17028 [Fusarium verticillioides 7600]|uniref:Uncharacterized protein n=1 Tax=Gibberella moniliformis (strain M3125 / FGSC 7600) TaxID=334819 RepID=W7MP12_GIBM7|nr:hypothetical protein FVEG_17028 [Fusarium verticillioides 7600]EWG52826.1 hypothetical protein FVEG_17028 [Fusarium verticillioides 7600]